MNEAAARRQGSVRGIVAEIDRRVEALERELERYERLRAEHRRLRRARESLTGGPPRMVTQDEVAAYLERHPGARVSEIAGALGVATNTISAHLQRGRDIRFTRGPRGWGLVARSASSY